MKKLRVLSLFDGIGGGRIALDRVGIPVEVYYASEIDRYAISIMQYNYPSTIQLGDINNLDFNNYKDIDIIIGGSPCQDLSIAKQNREGLKGEKSKLFWKFIEALEIIRPKYYLLENVASMKDTDKEAITEVLSKMYPSTECIMINSALLSGQNRKRYYWTNWHKTLPKDKGIYLKDILENGVGVGVEKQGKELKGVQKKSSCLMARDYKGFGNQQMTGVIETLEDGSKKLRRLTPLEYERLQTVPEGYTQYGIMNNKVVKISNTQRYKALGNGWTIDVIAHIFKDLKDVY